MNHFVPEIITRENFVVVKTARESWVVIGDPSILTLESVFMRSSFVQTNTELRRLERNAEATDLGGFVLADRVTTTVNDGLLGTVLGFNVPKKNVHLGDLMFDASTLAKLPELRCVQFTRKYGMLFCVVKNIDFGWTLFVCAVHMKALPVG